MKYQYGMRFREFAPSCQPMNGLIDHTDVDKTKTGFWTILTYDRELTESEIREYELTPIM